ncbi:MAG: hypothetical protein ACXADU_04615 [Promethearchaeota archaeon]|jgi:hypothetical protein
MVIELIASIYAIIIGITMFCMWIFLLGKKEVPELTTKPTQIFFHLVAELLTSIILIIGGIGLIMDQSWGVALFFISIGMAIYSTINAAGFYGQLKDWPMFIILLVFTLVSLLITTLILLVEFQIL